MASGAQQTKHGGFFIHAGLRVWWRGETKGSGAHGERARQPTRLTEGMARSVALAMEHCHHAPAHPRLRASFGQGR